MNNPEVEKSRKRLRQKIDNLKLRKKNKPDVQPPRYDDVFFDALDRLYEIDNPLLDYDNIYVCEKCGSLIFLIKEMKK